MNAVLCVLCNRNVNLSVDLCCDGDGKAVHGECYFNHIIGHSTANLQPFYEVNVETFSTALHPSAIVLDPRVCSLSIVRMAC